MRLPTALSWSLRALPRHAVAASRAAPAATASSRLWLQSDRSFSSYPTQSTRQQRSKPQFLSFGSVRYNSSDSSSSRPLTDRRADQATDEQQAEQNRLRRGQEPAYQISFTCKPCGHRSSHRMSKHGYHRGTVLIQCPSCQNRHVISDHLGIFLDQKSTLEDILSQKGQVVKKGFVNGDMEFWDDGTTRITEQTDETKPE